MEIDDPLIDMEPKDILDLIRIYSTYTVDYNKEPEAIFVP